MKGILKWIEFLSAALQSFSHLCVWPRAGADSGGGLVLRVILQQVHRQISLSGPLAVSGVVRSGRSRVQG